VFEWWVKSTKAEGVGGTKKKLERGITKKGVAGRFKGPKNKKNARDKVECANLPKQKVCTKRGLKNKRWRPVGAKNRGHRSPEERGRDLI